MEWSPPLGISGLTLGGGLGWLMGRYGMAVDNLRSAEVVTADGTVLTANRDENPNLSWAIRGGGGNFARRYLTRVPHPSPHDRRRARRTSPEPAGWRVALLPDYTADLPDALTVFAGSCTPPTVRARSWPRWWPATRERKPDERSRKWRRSSNSGHRSSTASSPCPTRWSPKMLDQGFPKGALNYWKSAFFKDLDDGAIEALIGAFEHTPSVMNKLIIKHYHGEATRIDPTATAFPHREPGYDLVLISQWADPHATEANVTGHTRLRLPCSRTWPTATTSTT